MENLFGQMLRPPGTIRTIIPAASCGGAGRFGRKGDAAMKKKTGWRERMATALELPRDLACHDAVVTVTGPGLAVVENYRGLVRYTREEIILSTRRGMITIRGRQLEIPCYTSQEMQVTGRISGIFFAP